MCDVEFCSDSVEKLQFHMSVKSAKSGKQKKSGMTVIYTQINNSF